MDDLIPIAEAATILGASRATAHRWASNGTLLGAVQMGSHHKWFVPRSEVMRLLEKRATTSRQNPFRWIPMTERDGMHT